MNFIAATVELRAITPDSINAYGLEYRGADAVIPAASSSGEVKLRALCYDRGGPKLDTFLDWKPGTRALVTGYLVFSDDTAQPLDLLVTTIEPNIPQDMYCNQVVLGNAFFGSDEIKERKMDKSQSKSEPHWTTQTLPLGSLWNFMKVADPSLLIESGKDVAYASMVTSVSTRKEGDTSPYRAIVANDFSTRKERERTNGNSKATGSAKGYGPADVDPTPDY